MPPLKICPPSAITVPPPFFFLVLAARVSLIADCVFNLRRPVLPGRRTQAAMFNLVSLLKEGLGVPQNTSEADRLTLASAEAGYVHAQRSLGQMCLERRRPADAAKWFRLAAEQGCAIAQNQLGNLCDDGIGVPRSSTDAVRW